MDWSLNSAKYVFWKMENEFLLNSFNMMVISELSTTKVSLHSYNKTNIVMIYYFFKVLLECLLMQTHNTYFEWSITFSLVQSFVKF